MGKIFDFGRDIHKGMDAVLPPIKPVMVFREDLLLCDDCSKFSPLSQITDVRHCPCCGSDKVKIWKPRQY